MATQKTHMFHIFTHEKEKKKEEGRKKNEENCRVKCRFC